MTTDEANVCKEGEGNQRAPSMRILVSAVLSIRGWDRRGIHTICYRENYTSEIRLVLDCEKLIDGSC